MEFYYHSHNKNATHGITDAILKLHCFKEKPVIVCIGSDLAIGDSLGPICGSLLKNNIHDFFIYGCLKKPVTAKEIQYINSFIKNTHPKSPIIAIDAAVGNVGDVGLIKIVEGGIYPGSGVNKKLNKVGDIGIMGIVAERSLLNYSILHATRLNLVYSMANIISVAIQNLYRFILTSSSNLNYFLRRDRRSFIA